MRPALGHAALQAARGAAPRAAHCASRGRLTRGVRRAGRRGTGRARAAAAAYTKPATRLSRRALPANMQLSPFVSFSLFFLVLVLVLVSFYFCRTSYVYFESVRRIRLHCFWRLIPPPRTSLGSVPVVQVPGISIVSAFSQSIPILLTSFRDISESTRNDFFPNRFRPLTSLTSFRVISNQPSPMSSSATNFRDSRGFSSNVIGLCSKN